MEQSINENIATEIRNSAIMEHDRVYLGEEDMNSKEEKDMQVIQYFEIGDSEDDGQLDTTNGYDLIY